MKTKVLGLFVIVLVFFVTSCKSPTTPEPPLANNVFKVSDIHSYDYTCADYTAIASWQNHDDADATVSGTVDLGDGATRAVTGPNCTQKSSSGVWESYRIPAHLYAVKGTYTVTFTLTAHFKRGAVTDTFSKSFEIK